MNSESESVHIARTDSAHHFARHTGAIITALSTVIAALIGAVAAVLIARQHEGGELRRQLAAEQQQSAAKSEDIRRLTAAVTNLQREIQQLHLQQTNTAASNTASNVPPATISNLSPEPAIERHVKVPSPEKRVELSCGDGYQNLPDYSAYTIIIEGSDCWTYWQRPPSNMLSAAAFLDGELDVEDIVEGFNGQEVRRSHYGPLGRKLLFVRTLASRFRNPGKDAVTLRIYPEFR